MASLENRRLRIPPCLVPNDRFFLCGAGRIRQLSFFANGNNGSRRDRRSFGFIAGKRSVKFRFPEADIHHRVLTTLSGSSSN